MKPCTSLSLLVGLFLAACSSQTEPASTFPESNSSSSTPSSSSSTTSTSLPTDPAPADTKPADAKPADPPPPAPSCSFGNNTADGCQRTYEIDLAQAFKSLPQTCNEGKTVYNDCSGEPIQLSWTDVGDRAPKSATLEFGVSIYCGVAGSSDHHQSVSINGGEVGGFEADDAACTCNAGTTAHSFAIPSSALAGWKVGGENSFAVNGPNRCLGVSGLDGSQTVARIVVTY